MCASTSESGRDERRFVIGVGASAGGLNALQEFFENYPSDVGFTVVVIQHLSPDHKSLMAEILAHHTTLPIRVVTNGTRLERDTIYVNPPTHNVAIVEGHFQLTERQSNTDPNYPIDLLMSSLAACYGDCSIGVVLSGTGTDGTIGCQRIKSEGGIVFAQDESAEFDGMPRSAIASGAADVICPPAEIPRRIVEYSNGRPAVTEETPSEDDFERLLDLLLARTGADFREYRPQTTLRRIEKRMRLRGIESLGDYVTLLEATPGEAEALRQEITIGVTEFFRDGPAFEAFDARAVAEVVKEADTNTTIRVWCVGCSTGEEAYSVAMCFEDAVRASGRPIAFKIFATDLDPQAIAVASSGTYPQNVESQIRLNRQQRYFRRENDTLKVRQTLRQKIVFAVHNVAKDPPFTNMDVVVCRNVLIYFKPALQERVISYMRFALKSGGTLFLGSSENCGSHETAFEPIDRRLRLFRRRAMAAGRGIELPSRHRIPDHPRAISTKRPVPRREDTFTPKIAAALLASQGAAAIAIDAKHGVQRIFGRTAGLLQVPEGTPTTRLEDLLEENVHLATTDLLRRMKSDETCRTLSCVAVGSADEDGVAPEVRITLHRLELAANRSDTFYLLVFGHREQRDLDADPVVAADGASEARARAIELELAEAREELHTTIDELEVANQELQSANEELIASNEELQSTNEELHSVNEELHTVNAEHQRRIHEQDQLAADLDHLLEASEIGSVFLDEHQRVRKFTPAITSIVPVLPSDVGRPIAHIRHDMPDIDLTDIAGAVFEMGEPLERGVSMEDGRRFLLRATPYRQFDGRIAGVVVNFVDVTEIQRTQDSLAASEERFRQIAEHISEVLWSRDGETGSIQYVNSAFERVWQRSAADLIRRPEEWIDTVHPDDRSKVAEKYANLGTADFEMNYRLLRSDGETRWIRDRGFPVFGEDGNLVRFAGIAEDVTANKRSEEALRRTADDLEEMSIRDPLTGLVNRRGLDRVLARELARSQRAGTSLVGMLIDCDDFKAINDRYGHAFGDLALVEISTRLNRALRPTDCVARIGGDEFLALLPDTRMGEAYRIAERLRRTISTSAIEGETVSTMASVSIGVSRVKNGSEAMTTSGLVTTLQRSLKHSKMAGKNRVAAGDRIVSDGTSCTDDLSKALHDGVGLRVVAQSIREIDSGRCVGFELLSRGPNGMFEEPGDLFRVSIERDLLAALDTRCLSNCLETMRAHGDRLPGQIHVNVYPSTLVGFDPEEFDRLFDTGDLGHQTLCVELSEQQVLGEPSQLRRRVHELKNRGVRVALDDVGFGRSSLEALIMLEPDVIKIDRAFVQGCGTDRGKRVWLERLVAVARTLEASVIAEGIENRVDLDIVHSMGIDKGQGFLWDRPHPVETVRRGATRITPAAPAARARSADASAD